MAYEVEAVCKNCGRKRIAPDYGPGLLPCVCGGKKKKRGKLDFKPEDIKSVTIGGVKFKREKRAH